FNDRGQTIQRKLRLRSRSASQNKSRGLPPRLSCEQHFSPFALNNATLNLARLHFAALGADSNVATCDGFAHARFQVAKNDAILRVKVYYFANLDIIHEFHFSKVATYGFDDGDGGSCRSGQDQFSYHSSRQVHRVHLASSFGANVDGYYHAELGLHFCWQR